MFKNLSKLLYLVILVIIIIFSQGCATIIHGPSQSIAVSSNPTKAKVQVDGGNTYTTPTRIKLARKQDHILIFSKEGYQQKEVTIMHVISGAVAGNIIAGGLIGWGVDALTGAQYRLVPETVHVELEALKEDSTKIVSPTTKLTPKKRLKKLDELLKEGLISQKEYDAMRKIILEKITEE